MNRYTFLMTASAISLTSCKQVDETKSGSHIRKFELTTNALSLPDGPGKDEFAAGCLVCHSSRYVAIADYLVSDDER